jgi:large subunit ribosomal protein L2
VVFIYKYLFLKKCKPINSSLRFRVNIDKKLLNIQKFKRLFIYKKNNSGRNNFGKITVRYKGGGLFSLTRVVDFYRLITLNGTFISYDIDKSYSCYLAIIKYSNGIINYILAPHNIHLNKLIKTTFDLNINEVGITKPIG